jgi:mannose-6-phosphate isomerase-like protein (cupin superfamily)
MNMRVEVTAKAEMLWFGNTLVVVNLSSSSGKDGISVVDHWMPCGEAPPLHIHHNEDEVFHILEGTMRFRVAERELVAHAGETVLAPKGIPHAFRVESTNGARCLTITTGPDFETMLKSAARPAERAGLPDAVAPTPEMIDRLVKICADNHVEIVGPPLA